MEIFIDEAGQFTPSTKWSVVCSLALPHKEVGPARRKLTYISRSWPKSSNGELKGGSLDGSHLGALVDLLYERDALLHATAIDVSAETLASLEAHKQAQCEGHTRHLTDEHHPSAVEAVWSLRHSLERMPMQLYLQSVAMSDLVKIVVEQITMYFAQRRPRELAALEWTIDAKDPLKITTQEHWWRATLGPLLESSWLRDPLKMCHDDDFEYQFFEKSFRFEKMLWRPGQERKSIVGYDIKKILTERISFNVSQSDILLQAVDILSNFLRRCLNGEISDINIARTLGRIQIHQRIDKRLDQSIHLITLSRATQHSALNLGNMVGHMARAGRPMLRRKAHKS